MRRVKPLSACPAACLSCPCCLAAWLRTHTRISCSYISAVFGEYLAWITVMNLILGECEPLHTVAQLTPSLADPQFGRSPEPVDNAESCPCSSDSMHEEQAPAGASLAGGKPGWPAAAGLHSGLHWCVEVPPDSVSDRLTADNSAA
jgi:hypothetical protein